MKVKNLLNLAYNINKMIDQIFNNLFRAIYLIKILIIAINKLCSKLIYLHLFQQQNHDIYLYIFIIIKI